MSGPREAKERKSFIFISREPQEERNLLLDMENTTHIFLSPFLAPAWSPYLTQPLLPGPASKLITTQPSQC